MRRACQLLDEIAEKSLLLAGFNEKPLIRANQEIIDEWSQQLMEVSNKELFPKVKSSIFTPF